MQRLRRRICITSRQQRRVDAVPVIRSRLLAGSCRSPHPAMDACGQVPGAPFQGYSVVCTSLVSLPLRIISQFPFSS